MTELAGIAQRLERCLNAGQDHSRLFQNLLDFRLERLASVFVRLLRPSKAKAYQSELRRPRF